MKFDIKFHYNANFEGSEYIFFEYFELPNRGVLATPYQK